MSHVEEWTKVATEKNTRNRIGSKKLKKSNVKTAHTKKKADKSTNKCPEDKQTMQKRKSHRIDSKNVDSNARKKTKGQIRIMKLMIRHRRRES